MNLKGLDCWDDYPMEHGCICGNDCAPPLRVVLAPIFWAVFDPDSSTHGNVQAALDAMVPIIEARIAAARLDERVTVLQDAVEGPTEQGVSDGAGSAEWPRSGP